jgi:hypothetical protein
MFIKDQKVTCNGNPEGSILHRYTEHLWEVGLWQVSRHVGDVCVSERDLLLDNPHLSQAYSDFLSLGSALTKTAKCIDDKLYAHSAVTPDKWIEAIERHQQSSRPIPTPLAEEPVHYTADPASAKAQAPLGGYEENEHGSHHRNRRNTLRSGLLGQRLKRRLPTDRTNCRQNPAQRVRP